MLGGEQRDSIPREIWVLGLVSLFMDLSSEMIHALLPIYITGVLGASALTFGMIEGVAESVALITKLFSGALSDLLQNRKGIAVFGYSLSAVTKPIFPLSDTIYGVVFARFLDRIGKGIRGAPRDAMVGEFAPPALRGACFGLRQSLDTVGAFLGPLVAILLLTFYTEDLRVIFWVACLPAVTSALLITFGVSEPEVKSPTESKSRRRFHYSALRELPKPFWAILAVSFALTLARFSEGFLILQAQEIGIGLALLPLVLVFMNISYAASSYQAGKLSDKLNRELVLAIGIFILIVADLIVAFSHSTGWFALGIALWGLHLGFTQGVISAIVADHTSKDILGTAFGFLNFSMGIATLFASAIAGFAWDISGPSSTFQLGALLSTLALLLLLIAYRQYASPLRPDESNT